MKTYRFFSSSENQTRAFAKRLSRLLRPGDCLALMGDFGSGKTTFVRGLVEGLGRGKKNYVSSPSFVILKIYKGQPPVYHFDLWRLKGLADLEAVGFDEFVSSEGVCVIEWAQKIKRFLPPGALVIQFLFRGQDKRELRLSAPRATTKTWGRFLKTIPSETGDE